jgi:hypothetical protein
MVAEAEAVEAAAVEVVVLVDGMSMPGMEPAVALALAEVVGVVVAGAEVWWWPLPCEEAALSCGSACPEPAKPTTSTTPTTVPAAARE